MVPLQYSTLLTDLRVETKARKRAEYEDEVHDAAVEQQRRDAALEEPEAAEVWRGEVETAVV